MKLTLRTKLTVLTVLAASLPILIVGNSVLNVNRDALQQSNRELLSVVTNDITSDVEVVVRESKAVLDRIASSLSDPDIEEEMRINVTKAVVGGQSWFSSVGIYDSAGAQVDTFAREGQKQTRAQSLPGVVPETARREAEGSGLSAFRSTAKGELIVVAPIRGNVVWFAAGFLALEELQEKVESTNSARLSRGGSVFVLDEERRLLVHSDRELLEAEKTTAHFFDDSVYTPKEKISVFGEYVRDGVELVVAARTIENFSWTVVAEEPTDIVYESIRRSRNFILGATAAAVLIAVLLAFFVSRKLVAPVASLLTFSRSLAERRFSERVHVKSNDELKTLGDAFNAAAEELEAGEAKIAHEISVRRDLSRYLPEDLVEKVMEQDDDFGIGVSKREVSVLFADVASFHALAKSEGAERVASLLNEFFTVVTEIVFRHGGIVDKFIGDCVMAVWGGVSSSEDHAERAVAAARDIVIWIDSINELWCKTFGVRLYLSVGVSSGEALVGNFGSESRMEYSALGDTVGIAAKLEEMATPGQVLLAGRTVDQISEKLQCIPLGKRYFSGVSEEVDVFELAV